MQGSIESRGRLATEKTQPLAVDYKLIYFTLYTTPTSCKNYAGLHKFHKAFLQKDKGIKRKRGDPHGGY